MAVQGVNSTSMINENNVTDVMDEKGCGERKETGKLSLTSHSDKLSDVSTPLIDSAGKQEELVIQSNLDGIYNNNTERTSDMGNRVSTGACVLPASKIFPTNCSDSTEENLLEGSNVTKACFTDNRRNRKKKTSKDQCLGMPTKIFATGSMFSGNSKVRKDGQDTKPSLLFEGNDITNVEKGEDKVIEVQNTRVLPAVGDCNIPETLRKAEENTLEICGKPSVMSIERKLSYLSVPPFEVPESDKPDSSGEKTKVDSANSPLEEFTEGTECIVAVDEKTCSASTPKDPKNAKVNCHGWWKFDLGNRKQKLQTKNRKFAFGNKKE